MEDKQPQEETPVDNEHVHIWNILEVQIPQAPVHHPRIGATKVTIVLIKCKVCNLPQTIELDEHWTLEQILKNHARTERRDIPDE